MRKRTSINKELKKQYEALQRSVQDWIKADDGSLKGLERDTKATNRMIKISDKIKKGNR